MSDTRKLPGSDSTGPPGTAVEADDSYRFALFMNLQGQPALAIGNGPRLLRKIARLREAGARVQVCTIRPGTDLQQWIQRGDVEHIERQAPDDETLRTAQVILVGTGDAALDKTVAERARALGRLVNVVDDPEASNFLIPSLVQRGPVRIAISSGGRSPVLARLLRARIEAFIPTTFSVLAQLAARFAPAIRQRIPQAGARRRFWEDTLGGRLGDLMLGGNPDQAAGLLQSALDTFATSPSRPDGETPGPDAGDATSVSHGGTLSVAGEVFLVGAGPGDPDLLSFRALRLMQRADVVLYDRLVSADILALVRADAKRVYVGKRRSDHTVPQTDINSLLVEHARRGHRVLRLKGGDPFIFGRGGEEIEQLAADGIAFEVVPGITAAAGCASYAGIPLTHRDYSQTCIFVTGHLKDGTIDLNWPQLAQANQTVVVYMGLVGLPIICEQLIAHGLAADTPIALIAEGTTPRQQVLSGTLCTLPGLAANTPVPAPTLLIIGQVVRLREQLAWFRTGGRVSPV